MTYIESDKLIGILPINEKLQALKHSDGPASLLSSLMEIYPKEPLAKITQALGRIGTIGVNEMAVLLAEEEFTLEVTAGALKDVYSKTTNNMIVTALKQKRAYPNTSRNEMLSATRWTGDKENPGMALSQFESIAAVTPSYPQIQVLEYNETKGAYLIAQPDATLKVFLYQNDRNNEWNWNLNRDVATHMYQSDDVRVDSTSDKAGRGLFNIEKYKNWYYDISLFPDTNELHQQILGLLAYSCNAQSGSFVIQSTTPWRNIGVEVGLEGPVEITYKIGEWTCNPKVNRGKLYDGNGSYPQKYTAQEHYAMKGVNEGALVGRVGNSTFLVGNHALSPSNLSGNIELCINDDLTGYYGEGISDNKGELTVVVTRTGIK